MLFENGLETFNIRKLREEDMVKFNMAKMMHEGDNGNKYLFKDAYIFSPVITQN